MSYIIGTVESGARLWWDAAELIPEDATDVHQASPDEAALIDGFRMKLYGGPAGSGRVDWSRVSFLGDPDAVRDTRAAAAPLPPQPLVYTVARRVWGPRRRRG